MEARRLGGAAARIVALSLVLAASVAHAEPPRLVVQLVVDQLSMAQLDRASDLLSRDGFGRLLTQGFIARDARYLGGPTVTAHGHATLATGAYGARHGIVANKWYEPGRGMVHVCHDDRYKLVTRETRPWDCTSPAHLMAPTVADALRWSRPNAKVVTVSLKDRASVLSGGGRPDAAVWYDHLSDRWTTSTYYGALPAWVPTTAPSAGITSWTRLADQRLCAFLPADVRPKDPAACAEKLAVLRAGLDDDPVERGFIGFDPPFPHGLPPEGSEKRGRVFKATPLADEALLQLAVRAIEGAKLGADETPDLLVVSLSAFDTIGHDFGPESHESLDALLRIDRALATFLGALDRHVGQGRWVLALSADHGVQPTPAKAARAGLSAGTIDTTQLPRVAVDGLKEVGLVPGEGFAEFVNVGLSFVKPPPLEDRSRADSGVIEALRRVPGVADVYPRTLLLSGNALSSDAAFYARTYFDGRSPDFIVQPRPLWTFGDVASHGTSYIADTRVPFIFLRGGRSGGEIDGVVDIASFAPTLAGIAGVAPPAAAEGATRTEVVRALK